MLIMVAALPQGQQQTPPLVLLIPAESESPPQIAPLTPTRDGRSFVARFDKVPPGDYLLVVEPEQEHEASRGESSPDP